VKIYVEKQQLPVPGGMQRPIPYLSFEVNLAEFRFDGLECVEMPQCLAQDESSTTHPTANVGAEVVA
jgi:hypothetical protein